MDVACFCGFRIRLVADLGICPRCGDYVTLNRVSDAEASQMRAELGLLLHEGPPHAGSGFPSQPRPEPTPAIAVRRPRVTGAEPTPESSSTVFVELDTRQSDGFTVSLEWSRDTGQTQIVVYDARTARRTVFGVPGVYAADALHHPFRYAP